MLIFINVNIIMKNKNIKNKLRGGEDTTELDAKIEALKE